jgi:hypothetical protein
MSIHYTVERHICSTTHKMIHIGIFNNKKIDNEPTRKIMAEKLDGENSINAKGVIGNQWNSKKLK